MISCLKRWRIYIWGFQQFSECHDVAAANLSDFWNNINKNASKGNVNAMEKRKFAPVGTVLPGVRISVRSDDLEEQPPGVPGEVICFLCSFDILNFFMEE